MPRRLCYIFSLWVAFFSGSAFLEADDVVHILSGESGRVYQRKGLIKDYTGRQLILEPNLIIPTERVVRIETTWSAKQQAADAALENRKFSEALVLYYNALEKEQRKWVRRKIIAQIVWCHRALGQTEKASSGFRALVQSDPTTQYFDCIPLAWKSSIQVPNRTALAWLERKDLPAMVLVGASHLMSSTERRLAIAKLQQLTHSRDLRIAHLAQAQIWRSLIVTASDKQVDSWSETIERMPQAVRAGPYFVLGQVLSHKHKSEQALLALMRIPILYPRQRRLASESLLESGRLLEKSNQSEDALRLYRELVRDYPETAAAPSAREILNNRKTHNSK